MSDIPDNPSVAFQRKPDARKSQIRNALTSIQIALLIGLFLIGGIVRFNKIGKENMWFDELASVEYSMGRDAVHTQLPLDATQTQPVDLISLKGAAPWWEIWTHLHISSYGPLYHIALRWWMDIFGESTGSVRSVSAFFSLLILPVFFDVCRRMFKPAAALIATALMTITIGQIGYAQEARCYSMLMLVMLCAADLVLIMEESGAPIGKVILLTVLLLAAELTQYFAAGAMVGLAIYVAMRFNGKDRWRTLAAFGVAAVLFLAVWGQQLINQRRGMSEIGQVFVGNSEVGTVTAILALPVKFMIGEVRQFFGNLNTNALLGIGLFIFAYSLFRLWRWNQRESIFWQLWTWGSILTVAALNPLAHTNLVLNPRYVTLAAPGVCALVACCQLPTRRKMVRYIPGLLAIIFVLPFTFRWMQEGFFDAGDMHAMAELIDSQVPSDGLVIFYSDSKQVPPGAWYMGWRYYAPQSKRDWLAIMSPPTAQTETEAENYKSVWGVSGKDPPNWTLVMPGWHAESQEICSAGSLTKLARN